MSETTMRRPLGIHKRMLLVLGATMAAVAMYFAATAPTALANEPFCGQILQPFGHSGDRCWGGGHDLFAVKMITYERAGCVDVANSNNELLESWRCASANSGYELFYSNDGVRRKGVIRNNNLSFTGYFLGTEACYTQC